MIENEKADCIDSLAFGAEPVGLLSLDGKRIELAPNGAAPPPKPTAHPGFHRTILWDFTSLRRGAAWDREL
jgi:hypothetical protein